MDSTAEAIQLARDVKYIHKQGGFEIRSWISNSDEVIKALNEDAPIKTDLNMNPDNPVTEKVLGMWWCTSTDTFRFQLTYNEKHKEFLLGTKVPTKRELLCILMSVFDPLGLLSHFLIFAKMILQEVWRAKLEWDDKINTQHNEKWLYWTKQLPQIEDIRIPRCYLQNSQFDSSSNVQLHIFVDASLDVYAAVVYLRTEQPNNTIEISFVSSKARVTPIKILYSYRNM